MGVVSRGQVWWVDLGEPTGSAPGYRRPALVVSSDRFNRSKIATVVLAAITSNVRLGDAPGNVAMPKGTADLPKASVVNVSQLLTVDRAVLESPIGALDTLRMRAVDDGLRLVLSV